MIDLPCSFQSFPLSAASAIVARDRPTDASQVRRAWTTRARKNWRKDEEERLRGRRNERKVRVNLHRYINSPRKERWNQD